MEPLLRAYPELAERITCLTEGASWCLTGASALLHGPDDVTYFELTKPKHWIWDEGGQVTVGIGGIGGSLEPGESALACLYREAREEILTEIEVLSVETTYLVYEERIVEAVSLAPQEMPCPALFTISENLYRREALSAYQVLAIATFSARVLGAPQLGDLFGLLSTPADALPDLLRNPTIRLEDALALPGLRITTREPIADLAQDAQVKLSPVWTGRSLQVLLQGGYLELGAGV